MTALSLTAYAVWIFLATLFFRNHCLPRVEKAGIEGAMGPVRGIGMFCLAAGAFFCVPPGSLPPFFNASWGGAAFLGCLTCASLLAGSRAHILPLVLIASVTLVFFCYAWQRGMPGSAANLGTFTGMPVWGIASPLQACGFAALVLGFLLAVRMTFSASVDFSLRSFPHCSIGAAAQCLAVCALFVSLFMPWNTAPYLPLPDALVAGCDFALFWGKVACLAVALHHCPPVPARRRFLAVVCCVVGTALIVLAGN